MSRHTYLRKEMKCRGKSGRVPGYVFDPRIAGYEPHLWPHVLDGSKCMPSNNREAICVEGAHRDASNVSIENGVWFTIERFHNVMG